MDLNDIDIGKFDPGAILQWITHTAQTIVKLPFQLYYSLPLPVQIAVKIAVGCVALLLIVLIWKSRNEWQDVQA